MSIHSSSCFLSVTLYATVAVASHSRIIFSKTYQQQLRGLAYPSGHLVYNKPNQWRSHNMTHRIQMCQTPSDVVDVGYPERSYIHPLKALCHSVSTRGTSKKITQVCVIFWLICIGIISCCRRCFHNFKHRF